MQISMDMVRAVVSAVERAGANREAFLARIGVDADELDRHAERLPIADYRRVLQAALDVTDDPVLGLHLGEHASSVMFQLPAHLVEHAATLGEALAMVTRYAGLLAQGFEPSLTVADERAALRFPLLSGDDRAVRAIAELAMTGFLRLLQQYVGELDGRERVCFAYPAPARADEYRRVFRGRERFAQPFTELQFPVAWLARSQLHANPELSKLLEAHAERQLALLERSGTVRTRLEQLLATSDHRALPSMSAAARALGISSKTVARKLRSEGVSFAELVERRRLAAAQRLLELRVLSVREVAEAMGFSDAAAFHKAFRRWTGKTPLQYVASLPRG